MAVSMSMVTAIVIATAITLHSTVDAERPIATDDSSPLVGVTAPRFSGSLCA